MRRRKPMRHPGWLRAVSYAVGLHAVVILLLVVGFRFTSKNPPAHGPLQAVVVREPGPEAREKEKTQREEEQKKREQEKQRVVEEEKRKEAEKVKLEAERKKKEEERKKQDEAKQKKEEADKKKQAAEAEKRKKEDERKKVEKEQRQQAEQALREQLAEEERSRQSARNARLASESDKYEGAIRQKVTRHWVRPVSSRKGLECVIRVRLLAGGEVAEVRIVQSSGDAAFDRSAEAAVNKASPLPLPENPELLERFREFNFRFKPES